MLLTQKGAHTDGRSRGKNKEEEEEEEEEVVVVVWWWWWVESRGASDKPRLATPAKVLPLHPSLPALLPSLSFPPSASP
ncbi:hypothetical protein E2C01_026206 [Portunus trituberculatus]|uniref:Uncharacterized protein n=1 Tax=Portunus trituberculatus TaxID=210409 RepID=A0A5B7EII5_PORTR|nr:hypothetical protein [Portunus trituberculatus]